MDTYVHITPRNSPAASNFCLFRATQLFFDRQNGMDKSGPFWNRLFGARRSVFAPEDDEENTMTVNPLILPDLREMLAEKDDAGLAQIAGDLHPAMLAEITEGLEVEETWQLLNH